MNIASAMKFPEAQSDPQVDAFSADDIMMFKPEEVKKEEPEVESEYDDEEEEEEEEE